MKKTVLLGLLSIFCSKETLGNRTFNLNYWSFKQCTPELAQEQYRAYFEKTNSTDVNNGHKLRELQVFSSLTEKCMRKSEIKTIKSFMAHFLLKHIMDARIAADGLGTDASLSSGLFAASNVSDAAAAGSIEDMGKAADEQVNKRRPNFETMYRRMIFLRYGILSYTKILEKASLLSNGKKTDKYNKKAANDAIQAEIASRKTLLLAACNKGSITPISLDSVEVIVGKFDWDDIKRVLPDVAKELENTLQRTYQIKKSLDAYQVSQLTDGAALFSPPEKFSAFDINAFATVTVH